MQEPQIVNADPKQLIGVKANMSIAINRTFELWHSFMPRRREIPGLIPGPLYSVQVYNAELMMGAFTPETVFEKWAAAEVSTGSLVPPGMEKLALPGGLYAVFLYKGNPTNFAPAFRYIFYEWLPASEYMVDNLRPHFEVLGEKYRNNSDDSEEEVWIPIKLKA